MKRWLATTLIGGYLSTLLYGLMCHTFNFNTGRHVFMYYIVWDMFCGWATYASKVHILAEGESGKYYELAPAPWGGFSPWGEMDRANYDVYGRHCGIIGMNTLRHTTHEPISRMFVVEETWSKKYDLPANVWKSRWEEPQRKKTYCRVLSELTGDGKTLRTYLPWLAYQQYVAVSSNPRLQEDARRHQPLLLVDSVEDTRGRDVLLPNASGIQGIPLRTPESSSASGNAN